MEDQLSSLKQIAEEMKNSLEAINAENSRLVHQNQVLSESVKEKEQQLVQSSKKRSTIHEETGIMLSQLQLSEHSVENALAKRGLSVVDLYTRIVSLEEEVEKVRKSKNECEL